MADKMMRISGRGEDGTAKPFATDNDGVSIVKNPVLKTTHHLRESVSSNGLIAEVDGYNYVSFQVVGFFEANVTFQATSYGEWWENIAVEDVQGKTMTNVVKSGIYKTDISGYERIRAVVEWGSGTSITIKSNATMASSSVSKSVVAGHAGVVKKTVSNHQIGRNIVFYGENNDNARAKIRPVNFEDYSKRSVFIKNNLNTAIKIIRYNKHIYLDSPDIIEWVETDIDIPVGGTGKLSYIQYPDLNEPFKGLSIDVQASGVPSSGEVEIYWLGGIN